MIQFCNPIRIFRQLWQYHDLIRQLTWREVISRYKGSFIGMGWSLIQPLIMLCIYTFVFSVIFKARWGVAVEESRADFGLALFMGLVTYNMFSELANVAPSLILGNANLVKKVVFPLEILPLVKFLAIFINALFGLAVILAGMLLVKGTLHWTMVLLPLVWFPMMLFSLGCGYFLSSLGVFIRDTDATMGMLTTMLLFMSPVFYPISVVPERLLWFYRINPFSIYVESARAVVLWGQWPQWHWYLFGLGVGLMVFVFGFVWFMKSKRAFADVM